jgi:hypothetical protein
MMEEMLRLIFSVVLFSGGELRLILKALTKLNSCILKGNALLILCILSNEKRRNWMGVHFIAIALLDIILISLQQVVIYSNSKNYLKSDLYVFTMQEQKNFNGSEILNHDHFFCQSLVLTMLSAPTLVLLIFISIASTLCFLTFFHVKKSKMMSNQAALSLITLTVLLAFLLSHLVVEWTGSKFTGCDYSEKVCFQSKSSKKLLKLHFLPVVLVQCRKHFLITRFRRCDSDILHDGRAFENTDHD